MLTIQINGLDAVQRRLGALGRQVPFAASKAINETAKRIQEATYQQMRQRFDRPTPYALRALFIKRSTKANLTAIVGLRQDAPGKGMSWQASLAHEFTGGNRRWRRFEAALNRIGILPPGHGVVPPRSESWAVSLDQYGNLSRGLIVTLLSYFQAFGEQGYKANSTQKSRDRRAKFGRTASGYKTINGVAYFAVLPGRERTRHFKQPGIYAKRGIHGIDVAPVMLFVRRPSYQKRIDLERIAKETFNRDFEPLFRSELDTALATAR